MKLSLKPQHLKRYRQIASILLRYGLSEVARSSGLEDLLGDDISRLTQRAHPKPAELAAELEEMGPTFVKLGQVLSTRGDLVPAEYIAALQTLQDRVGPVPYAEVEQVILEEFGLGVPHVFNTFEPVPLAAASLGQVHVAGLADGRKVAVKVQRPGIRARLAEDLDVLEELASVLEGVTEFAVRYRFKSIVADFRRTLMRELDYRTEAENLRMLGANLAGFSSIVVPQPVDELTTSRVLTMQLVTGKKVTDITTEDRAGFDGIRLANELQKAYMKQVCIDGFFHADPHPGNVLLLADGRIGLLDLGMVGRLSPEMRERLLRLLVALGEGRPEAAADLAVKIGHPGTRFDEARFRGLVKTQVTANAGATMAQIQLGRVIMDIARASADCGLQPPAELTMLGKTLLSLDEVGRAIAPGFDPYESIRRDAIPLVLQMLKQGASVTNVLGRILEVNEFGRELPARVNKILDRVADNRLEVRVRSFDEQELIQGLQKVANRITQGLLIAALVVGAALIMNVKTSFTIAGYPGLAVLLFLLAVAGALVLVWDILRHDRKR
ncbi:MAG: AarF/ABC1/UbiB kinase family protein [Planctomycetes bacterium]|nr:AarF/ABC1/UbiB kinase family protein [Planctomycetota bacterium]